MKPPNAVKTKKVTATPTLAAKYGFRRLRFRAYSSLRPHIDRGHRRVRARHERRDRKAVIGEGEADHQRDPQRIAVERDRNRCRGMHCLAEAIAAGLDTQRDLTA